MKAYVLGHPVEHSLSPVLHRAAYRVLKKQIEYSRWDTQESDLADRMSYAQGGKIVCGYSVTMPLKLQASQTVERLTDFAKTLGVVNTVYWRDGISWGHNTDVSGIVNALTNAGCRSVGTASTAVLGGGGTATSAIVALFWMGARSISLYVRNPHRTESVRAVAHALGISLSLKKLHDFAGAAAEHDAIISTLPPAGADQLVSSLGQATSGILLDVSYDPWPSAIATKWEVLGGRVVSGLEMLVYQAIDQVKLFTFSPLTEHLEHELEVLSAMCAVVGLPDRTDLPVQVYELPTN